MNDGPVGKKAVRERVLQLRAGLCGGVRAEKSAAVCGAVKRIPEYASAGSILFFMPIRDEVDISPLLHSALLQGRLCALPKCVENRRLRLFAITDPASDLVVGKWGIREPKECLPEYTVEEFSVIMVPGAAFDRRGGRIGYGAGYYDRLLARSNGVKIAPAFALQVLPELPREAHDVPVDIIATEERIIDCRMAWGDNHG